MKAKFLIFCLILTHPSLKGQLTQIELGRTRTEYIYTNDRGERLSNLVPQDGIKAAINFKTKSDNILIGLLYHELNAKSGTMAQIYEWETAYAGLSLYFKIPIYQRFHSRLGIGFTHLIKGEQFIDGQNQNLNANAEFNGFWLSPSISLGYKIKQISAGDFNLKYSLYPSAKIGSQGSEKLSFLSHHIGLEFEFKPQKKEQ